MNAWQRGYELEELKKLSSVFLARHKRLVYGAFGLIKERDIADALSEGRMMWVKNDGLMMATAIYKILKAPSESTDFTGAVLHIGVGTVLISAFACHTVEAGLLILKRALDGAQFVAVEIFEEDDKAKAAVAAAGLVWKGTKITAGAEIKGVYSNMQPAREISSCENASLKLVREDFITRDECAAVLREAQTWDDWAQHYSSYNKRKSWTAVALRGYKPTDPGFIIKPSEMSKIWKEQNKAMLLAEPYDTTVAAYFPVAMSIVDRIPGSKDRVRLMKLAGGGELTRHADITDREAGASPGKVARFHIPIITNENVQFCSWSARGEAIVMQLRERCMYYLDQRKPHCVQNNSPDVARIHLVVDTFVNEETVLWL